MRRQRTTDTEWTKATTGGEQGLWSGTVSRAFVHAHFHAKTGRHQEGERCPPDQAIPFWERILEGSKQSNAEEDAKAAAEEAQARDE
eukprot:1755449-Heterocapsa_arctica.AAC.1